MSSKNPFQFDGLIEFMEMFPNDKAANDHFALIRWNGNPVCPHCGHNRVYTYNDNKRYKCAGCKVQFTVKSGTIFEDSNIGMRKWFLAIYLLTNMKKGVSSHELSRKLKVTQKTAWFMEQRIRFAFQAESFNAPLNGVVEIDESFIGGKETNKHRSKRVKGTQGRSTLVKTGVIGMKERHTGRVVAFTIPDASMATMYDAVTQNVEKGSIIMTDEYNAYKPLASVYDHRTVVHKRGEYAVGIDNDTHCNGMENYWSHLDRSILGVNHHISRKHMNLYIAAQSFRYNTCKVPEWQRFTVAVWATPGKRITYKQLIEG